MNNALSFAVVFKTHYWDDFVERQFRRLCLCAGTRNVFIIVDETQGPVIGIQYDKVIRITEEISEKEGYLIHPKQSAFWYNTDYQIYNFFDNNSSFDYVFSCEYDCFIDLDVSLVIQTMANRQLGFVGERIRTPLAQWRWVREASPFYPDVTEIEGRLLCCAAFSREFAQQLQAARRYHTRLVQEGTLPSPPGEPFRWPNNEAFVGTEIRRLRIREAPLSLFADTSNYDWAPAHPEFALPSLGSNAIVHPVLDSRRYLSSIKKLAWKAEDLFLSESILRRHMERYAGCDVVPMFLEYFSRSRNFQAIEQLRSYATQRFGENAEGLFNIGVGKPATQSSISDRWSRRWTPALDAAGAVNGQITGDYGFHTDLDNPPWWCVDLEAVFPVREIRIYNRLVQGDRARGLVVSCSTDLVQWNVLFRHDAQTNIGGADGKPLQIFLNTATDMRFVRIHVPREEVMHLDEVQVYI